MRSEGKRQWSMRVTEWAEQMALLFPALKHTYQEQSALYLQSQLYWSQQARAATLGWDSGSSLGHAAQLTLEA